METVSRSKSFGFRALLLVVNWVLIVLSSEQTAHAQTPKKIALLVGVSNYFDKNMEDLTYAENDVEVIGFELKKLGFKVTTLTGNSASKALVDSQLDQFIASTESMKSEDIVFVMFSGHGQQLGVLQEKFLFVDGEKKSIRQLAETPFYCPYDSKPYDSTRHTLRGKTEKQVADEFNLISLNDVIGRLDKRSNSLRNLLVVDACRNNPAKGKSANITGSTTKELPRGLSIFFAAKSGQKSWESADDEIRHGVMSHYMIEGMQGKAKDDRNEITWGDLTNYVKKNVIRDQGTLAGGPDRIQNPHTISSSDDVIVLGNTEINDLTGEIRKDPKSAFAYAKRAHKWNNIGEHQEALKDLDTAIRLSPKYAYAYHIRGYAHSKLDNPQRAIDDYSVAIRLGHNAYSNRGAIYGKLKQYDKAVLDFTESIRMAPDSEIAYVNRGITYSIKKDYRKSIADFKTAIKINPNSPHLQLMYAKFVWHLSTNPDPSIRDGAAAIKYGTKACELSNWNNSNDIENLACAYAEAGQFDKALHWLKEANRLAPKLNEVNRGKMLQLFQSGKPYRNID